MKIFFSILFIVFLYNPGYSQDSIAVSKGILKSKVTHIYPGKKKKQIHADSNLVIQHNNDVDTTLCFPIIKDKLYNVYDYMIFLDDVKVSARYKPYFDKYQYKYSGYVWEAIIKQMLNDADKELSDYTILRSDKNIVMINITKYLNMKMFPDYMCSILSDMTRFDAYLKKIDRSRVPNY